MDILRLNPTEAELDAMMYEVDTDGSGDVDFDEFVDVMSRTTEFDLPSSKLLAFATSVIVSEVVFTNAWLEITPCFKATDRMRTVNNTLITNVLDVLRHTFRRLAKIGPLGGLT